MKKKASVNITKKRPTPENNNCQTDNRVCDGNEILANSSDYSLQARAHEGAEVICCHLLHSGCSNSLPPISPGIWT